MSKKKNNNNNRRKTNKETKNKTKNKNKNKIKKTQKTHRPYSSLDLTDPNFAFGRIFFYNSARIIKKSAVSDFKQNLLIWFEFL